MRCTRAQSYFEIRSYQMWKLAVVVLFSASLIWGQFYECHDDPAYDPDEGPVSELQFTWLGALQYIHVKNATPHYFRVPRVILISRQFVLSTANDAATVPEGYALGNVVFADYERDEEECHTNPQDVASQKMQCEPGILVMPLADVLLHPEYKHFGAKSSVALMKLITKVKSAYVVPVCLPFKNFLVEKRGKNIKEKIYHIDFVSDVPRDFIEEEKEITRLSLLPSELCYLYDQPDNNSRINKERIACTTGCGFRSGAPSVIHEHTGHWSVVSLSQGGCACPDPLRSHRPPAPPRHILLHPYVPWITSAITGTALRAFAKDDPFGYAMPRATAHDAKSNGWVGHWWMGGLRCYDRAELATDMYRFYHEVFQLNAGATTVIVCVKVGMPYRLGQPQLWDLDTNQVQLKIPLVLTDQQYSFQVEAWGFNETDLTSSTTSSESNIIGATLIWGQFYECHDDPAYDPDEGPVSELQFTWLGALQYIHVKNATPHYFRVPRVILISRQFVLSTAEDAASVPEGYALGNVVFADYERDEEECHTTPQEVESQKQQCEPGILVMPLADVLLHPEYKHFGAKSSVALLKLVTKVKSTYVVPVCLPFKNFLVEKGGRNIKEKLYHVDFISDVPRDFIEEEKEITRISLLPRELCYLYDKPDNSTRINKERIACTTGCGFRSGAPSVIHEHTGHWSIVSLSQGGCACPDPLRTRRPPAPPRHIILHPYVPWITAAITGTSVGAFAKDDPFGYTMPRATVHDLVGHNWVGHWWMGGLRCYDRGDAAIDMYRFYHEIFQVKPTNRTFMNYNLEISSSANTVIICIKVGMPYRLGQPKVWDLDTTEARVMIPLVYFSHQYSFQVEAWGYNQTDVDSTSSSDTSSSSD